MWADIVLTAGSTLYKRYLFLLLFFSIYFKIDTFSDPYFSRYILQKTFFLMLFFRCILQEIFFSNAYFFRYIFQKIFFLLLIFHSIFSHLMMVSRGHCPAGDTGLPRPGAVVGVVTLSVTGIR